LYSIITVIQFTHIHTQTHTHKHRNRYQPVAPNRNSTTSKLEAKDYVSVYTFTHT